MEQSFSVAIVSNENTDFFPSNTSFSFANTFSKHLNLAGYEVALTSLTYYDKHVPEKGIILPPPPPKTPPPPKQFFDLDKNENKFVVEKLAFIETLFKKNDANFVAFIGHVNDICFSSNVPVQFTLNHVKGVITSLVAETKAPENFHVQLTESFASILGFSNNIFANGTTTGGLPDSAAFDAISIDAVVGSIYLASRVSTELFLRQMRSRPNLSAILTNIILTLRNANIDVDITLNRATKSINWEGLGDIRIQFSKFLNTYLGQVDTFIFSDEGSFTVADDIIQPKKPDDDIPEPGPPPKVSCNKLLVTCSIIKDQWYGGSPEKLLALIERQEHEEFWRVNYIPQTLIYKEVESEFVSQIRIALLSDNKSYIQPYHQPTVCTLHFRKRFSDQ